LGAGTGFPSTLALTLLNVSLFCGMPPLITRQIGTPSSLMRSKTMPVWKA
jgi:hypothetical protein